MKAKLIMAAIRTQCELFYTVMKRRCLLSKSTVVCVCSIHDLLALWRNDRLYAFMCRVFGSNNNLIIIIFFYCKAPYIRKNVRSEAHKIHCNTYIFKIFIISLNLHVKMIINDN